MFRSSLVIAAKDMKLEWRTRESVTFMLAFAATMLLMFEFALGKDPDLIRRISSGLLWLAVLFTGFLGISRSFVREQENHCMEALLLCPVDRAAIFYGKFLANLSFILISCTAIVAFFAVFFSVTIHHAFLFFLLLFLGAVGICLVTTFFSAMVVSLRARDLLLPLLLFPLLVPVLINGVAGTEILLLNNPGNVSTWLRILFAFDVVFTGLTYLLFEYLVEN